MHSMQQGLALALALALATPYQAVAFVELPCAMRGLMLSTGGVSSRAISRASPALRMQVPSACVPSEAGRKFRDPRASTAWRDPKPETSKRTLTRDVAVADEA